jgi:ribosomal protein S18 acetylase RimI-like enzyme
MAFIDKTPLTVERASLEDALQIAKINRRSLVEDYIDGGPDLTREMWKERTGGEWLAQKTSFYTDRITDLENGAVFAARLNDKVAGFSMVEDDEITALYVELESRRRHIATRLAERALKWQGEQGYTSAELVVAPFLDGAIKMYESFGFRSTGAVTSEQKAGSPPGLLHKEMVLDDLAMGHERVCLRLGMSAIVSSFDPVSTSV